MYSVAVVLNPTYMRDITIDSFVSRPYEYTNWQARVGSLYFPAAPVSDPDSNGVEAFFASKMVFNKLKNEHQEGAVTYNSFKTGSNNSLCFSYEKNQALEISGLPLNNSRVLEIDATFGSAQNRQIYVFMLYNCVSRSYLDNTSVSI